MPGLVLRGPIHKRLGEGVDARLVRLEGLPVRSVRRDLDVVSKQQRLQPQFLAELDDPRDEAASKHCADGAEVLENMRRHVQWPGHPSGVARWCEGAGGDLPVNVRAELECNADDAESLSNIQRVRVAHGRGHNDITTVLSGSRIDSLAHVHPGIAVPPTIGIDLVCTRAARQVIL